MSFVLYALAEEQRAGEAGEAHHGRARHADRKGFEPHALEDGKAGAEPHRRHGGRQQLAGGVGADGGRGGLPLRLRHLPKPGGGVARGAEARHGEEAEDEGREERGEGGARGGARGGVHVGERGDDGGEARVAHELGDGRHLERGLVLVHLRVRQAGAHNLRGVVDGGAEEQADLLRGVQQVVRGHGVGQHAKQAKRHHVGHRVRHLLLIGLDGGGERGDGGDAADAGARGCEGAQAGGQPQAGVEPEHGAQAGSDGGRHHRHARGPQLHHLHRAQLGAHAHDAGLQHRLGAEAQAGLQHRQRGDGECQVVDAEAQQDGHRDRGDWARAVSQALRRHHRPAQPLRTDSAHLRHGARQRQTRQDLRRPGKKPAVVSRRWRFWGHPAAGCRRWRGGGRGGLPGRGPRGMPPTHRNRDAARPTPVSGDLPARRWDRQGRRRQQRDGPAVGGGARRAGKAGQPAAERGGGHSSRAPTGEAVRQDSLPERQCWRRCWLAGRRKSDTTRPPPPSVGNPLLR
mmetsp:Transcript_43402/g.112415  ORF Transcript_43402/g.112415 Transcript_43402/m.112415 type:complete len:515 (+) Transcript_43402:430-1974(+)